MLNAAIALVRRGWHVHILRPGTKVPATPNGQKDATIDIDVLTEWWTRQPDGNPAVACEPSGLYVVDVDMGPGKVGEASWAALTERHGHVDTFTVRTRSGGLHFYYAMPDGDPLRNTASKLAKDIDTRGNGYVVAPGAVVDGSPYRVEHDIPVAPLPLWIIDALTSTTTVHSVPDPFAPAGAHRPPASTSDVHARLAELCGELAAAPEGQGNDTAARIAFMVGGYCGAGQLTEHEATSALLDAIAGWQYRKPGDARTMESTIIRQVLEGTMSPREWHAPFRAAVDVTASGDLVIDPDGPDSQDTDEADGHLDASDVSDWSTDAGQARYLRDRIGGMLYNPAAGWHVWVGTHWQPVDEEYVSSRASEHYRAQFERMLDTYRTKQDEKWIKLAQAYRKFMGASKLASILKMLRITTGVYLDDAAKLDAHPHLLNTPEGMVNLRTGKILRHDPKALITKITRGNYRPGTTHPDWQQALKALPEELHSYAQLRFGQAVTGFTPESDDAVFLAGNGSNGKSLWTTDGVVPALGGYASMSGEGLIMTRNGGQGSATPERAALRGCRFVLIEELPEGRFLSVAELKRITGMSMINARDLYAKAMAFPASHTLFVTTNYLPVVNETDHGTWRRLCLMEFPYTFAARPTSEQLQGDPGLKTRLRGGAQGQHDAIVTWLVEGARRYLTDRDSLLQRPEPVKASVAGWRAASDRILAYVTARLKAAPGRAVVKSDVYADFCRFLEDGGHQKWSQELFWSRFMRHEACSGFHEAQTTRHDLIDRPVPRETFWTSALPTLPRKPWILTGLSFQTEED